MKTRSTLPVVVVMLGALVAACGLSGSSDDDESGGEQSASTTGAIRIGETNVVSYGDNGNGNLLVAQQATLGQSATVQSLSFYVTAAAGNLELGIYDASGPSGGPGAKKAETSSFATVTGWNTANVTHPVTLPAGSYWLAYLPSSNALAFRKAPISNRAPLSRYYGHTFGALPGTFATSTNTTSSHWSFYATLTPSAAPPPTDAGSPATDAAAHDAGGTSNPPPSGADVTVDFRTPVYPLDKWSIGSTISTYSGAGSANIIKSSVWAAKLAALGPLSWRIPLRYNGGSPGSGAGGAQTSGDAATYITTIRSVMGGTPYVVLSGNSTDNGLTSSDVAGFVHYFNDNNGARAGGKLERIVLGNEPDNGGGSAAYLASLDGWISAAKGADSSILVTAPAAAYWDKSLITSAATHAVDILSYHAYDGANTDGTGFPVTSQYHTHINDMRAIKSGLLYGCEEFNYHFNSSVSGFTDWHDLVFVASVIGQVVSAGGHANQYSDSNGQLGLLNDGAGKGQPGNFGDPLPAYYGIGMWTGLKGTFRGVGAHTVAATATNSDLDTFATDNGKVMLLNKSASTAHTVKVALGGKMTGVYSAWQTAQAAPTSAPTKVVNAASYSGATLTIALPAGTVTSIEID